ncbi:unnamed protein product [Kuraishia capsulata CBS 1993]|uniref:Uncharacterized protein n=1 Tax=Kuraishia capsulata CBS 1993 TaxID=1382522 RepID=W6MU19_9ASCO|nr:uncharacterized protein KUCA_T00006008001 [Kuraishia capsulata CBS 1993]CDK30013.1 unnamed protein product [Kuraishia capsulata CBS 1993]
MGKSDRPGFVSRFYDMLNSPFLRRERTQPEPPVDHTAFVADITNPLSPDTSSISSRLFQSKSANHLLGEFFLAKGDAPLSPIEREGVLSLLSKGNSNNSSVNSSLVLNNTVDESSLFVESKPPVLIDDSTKLKSLKTLPTFSPRYEPYRKHKDAGLRSITTRRVVNYSDLPSPFRTRIRSPLYMMDDQESRNDISKNVEVAELSKVEDTPKKSLSKTATALQSILDKQDKLVANKPRTISTKKPVPTLPPRPKTGAPVAFSTPEPEKVKKIEDVVKTATNEKEEFLFKPAVEHKTKPDIISVTPDYGFVFPEALSVSLASRITTVEGVKAAEALYEF